VLPAIWWWIVVCRDAIFWSNHVDSNLVDIAAGVFRWWPLGFLRFLAAETDLAICEERGADPNAVQETTIRDTMGDKWKFRPRLPPTLR